MFVLDLEDEQCCTQSMALRLWRCSCSWCKYILVLGKLYIVFGNSVHGTSAMDAFLQLVQVRFLVLGKF